MDFVVYYRVSTKRQGKSGLGLDSQRATVAAFLSRDDCVLAEFTDVLSGKNDNRVQLQSAIRLAKARKATLLIAKLDRFSRRVSFIASVMESGIKLAVAEMPNATDFQLHIFAALAQEERRLIGERTRSALQAAKQRGQVLGANGKKLADANRALADTFAGQVVLCFPENWQSMSLSAIARYLNMQGHRTRTGASFYPQTIRNIVSRLWTFDATAEQVGGTPMINDGSEAVSGPADFVPK